MCRCKNRNENRNPNVLTFLILCFLVFRLQIELLHFWFNYIQLNYDINVSLYSQIFSDFYKTNINLDVHITVEET